MDGEEAFSSQHNMLTENTVHLHCIALHCTALHCGFVRLSVVIAKYVTTYDDYSARSSTMITIAYI
jgi:hypothetical protein